MGKTILAFYLSFWWQLYLASFVSGFASALSVAVWTIGRRGLDLYAFLLRAVLYLAAFSVLAAVGLAIAHRYASPWEPICFLGDRFVGFFVDGFAFASLPVAFSPMKAKCSSNLALLDILLRSVAITLRTSCRLALAALSVEMAGAIYTHYHNYLVRGIPGPFSSSLDALRMLPLMAYLALAHGLKGSSTALRTPSREAI